MSVSQATPRHRSARRSKWRSSPAIWVLLIAAIIGLGMLGVREWRAGRVTLTFVRSDGAIPALELTVFPDQLSFGVPSPPPPLGDLQLQGSSSATFADDLVPARAAVRYRGEGVGAGVVFVELGRDLEPIELAAPRTIHGRVGEPIGFWAFGWRCAGLRPVANATIVAMAGGEHGIELASTQADAQGRFELSGVASTAHPLSLRVRADGYELVHVPVPIRGDDTPMVAAVQATRALRGVIVVPPGVDVSRLCVLARGLPGVQAYPDAAGGFVLDNLPPRATPRLLVYGLDPWHGCAEVRAGRDGDARLDVVPAAVVRGVVTDGRTGARIAGALVFAGDATAVRSGADGTFELTQVLPGRVELTAQYQPVTKKRRREPIRFGRVRLELHGGETRSAIGITVD